MLDDVLLGGFECGKHKQWLVNIGEMVVHYKANE